VIDVFEKFKPILLNPQYGYGKCLNPCLDCKIFMVNCAYQFMLQHQFDFLISGEVLGQRPKSQRKDTLPLVAKNTDDRLLRPLCAKLLPPTLPERENWVQRELLSGISGRSRKLQLELAQNLGIKDFPQPAGGCLLTDAQFTQRLKDLWNTRTNKNYTPTDIALLKIGRHLRWHKNFKMIIGRDATENQLLEKFKNQFITLHSHDYPGALALIDGIITQEELAFAARVIAYFSKGKNIAAVNVIINYPLGQSSILTVKPCSMEEIRKEWYVICG